MVGFPRHGEDEEERTPVEGPCELLWDVAALLNVVLCPALNTSSPKTTLFVFSQSLTSASASMLDAALFYK